MIQQILQQLYLTIALVMALGLVSTLFFLKAQYHKVALLMSIIRAHKDSLSDENKWFIEKLGEKL
jgi:hypothetical protein